MKVLGLVGPDAATATLRQRLVERLSDRGRVATVQAAGDSDSRTPDGSPINADRDAGATTALERGPDGWIGAGEGRSLDGVLESLAPEHDYALLTGYPQSSAATVVLGDAEAADPVVERAADADSVEVASLLETLEDLEPFVTLSSLVAAVKRAERTDRAGAIATFTGRVRQRDGPEDPPTEYLEFESYDEVAADRLAEIRAELCDREGVYEVLMHHRTGVIEAGQDIVFVVVLAGHRSQAFATVSDGIDRLKAEVPIFKKEVTVEETYWRHDAPAE